MLDGFRSDQSLWSYMPLGCEKNDVSSFSRSPLIRYLSDLEITRTGIKAQMSLNLGRIGLFTLELFTLESWTFFPIVLWWRKWCIQLFSVTLNSISIKLTVSEDWHKIMDKFELLPDLIDQSSWSYEPLSGEKNWFSFSIRSSSNLLATRTGIKSQWCSNSAGSDCWLRS